MNRTVFLICMLALMILFSSLQSQTIVVPDLKVNDELLTYKAYSQPKIIANDNGDFVIIWLNDNDQKIIMNFFDINGTKIKKIEIKKINSSFLLRHFDCLSLENDFIIFWLESNIDFSNIFKQSFSQDGEDKTKILNLLNLKQSFIKFRVNNNQDIILLSSNGGCYGLNKHLFSQYYDAFQNKLNSMVEITDFYNHYFLGLPDIAIQNDGNYAFTWEQEFEVASSGIYFQNFSQKTNKEGFNREITYYSGGNNPKICTTTDGNYIVTWQQAGRPEIFYRGIYNSDIDRPIIKIGIDNTKFINQNSVNISSGSDNDFIITWLNCENDSTKNIYGQYCTNLEPINKPFMITNSQSNKDFIQNFIFTNDKLYSVWAETKNDNFFNILTNVIQVNTISKTTQTNDFFSPSKIELFQNYPNPFNPTTLISYNLPKSDHVKLEIFDTLGKSVRVLVNETQNSGIKNINWDGTDNFGNRLSSGIYFYRLQTNIFNKYMKMTLVK